jgi:hypothetical protein
MLQERHGYSQRRACQIVGQHRSTRRHRPKVSDPDAELRAGLRTFAKDHQPVLSPESDLDLAATLAGKGAVGDHPADPLGESYSSIAKGVAAEWHEGRGILPAATVL